MNLTNTSYLEVPRCSPTVRGFAMFLKSGLDGLTPEEILSIPADFYELLGLEELLTHQRLNEVAAILTPLQLLALKNVEE